MNFCKVSKIFSLVIGSYFYCDFLQASQFFQNDLFDRVSEACDKARAVCDRLHKNLLTESLQEAMYQDYRDKKLTVEDVAEKIEKDKKARENLFELLELKSCLESLKLKIKS